MGFNRTFMELKSRSVVTKQGICKGFNRTFMELKYYAIGKNRLQFYEF